MKLSLRLERVILAFRCPEVLFKRRWGYRLLGLSILAWTVNKFFIWWAHLIEFLIYVIITLSGNFFFRSVWLLGAAWLKEQPGWPPSLSLRRLLFWFVCFLKHEFKSFHSCLRFIASSHGSAKSQSLGLDVWAALDGDVISLAIGEAEQRHSIFELILF